MLSQPLIKELQDILKAEYGLDLGVNEVTRLARELSGYFDLLAEINYENTKKLNKLNIKIECLQSNAIIIKR
ncbi:MAG: hypothetical protein WC349_04185 [Patescibacteria group bacterium]|jgi:hypothetical protein